MKELLAKLVDAGKLGGWVRAAVAAILTMIVAKLALSIPLVAQIVSPEMIDAIAIAAGTAVVGLWSQVVKPSA